MQLSERLDPFAYANGTDSLYLCAKLRHIVSSRLILIRQGQKAYVSHRILTGRPDESLNDNLIFWGRTTLNVSSNVEFEPEIKRMRTFSLKPSSSLLAFVLAGSFLSSITCEAQQRPEPVDLEVVNRIKVEELNRSQVMETVEYLTDVIGPRLTNSPNLRKAQQYAIDRLNAWGIPGGKLEPWGRSFGRGWSLENFAANMTAPGFSSLIAYPKAWSPSTAGVVHGEPVLFDVSTESDLLNYKGKLKGKIVLFSPAREVAPSCLKPELAGCDTPSTEFMCAIGVEGRSFVTY